jgi:thioredoxin
MLLTNLIAVARWPIVWLISLTLKKELVDRAPLKIESFPALEATLERNEYVLVDFWAQWCGPCMLMNPAIEETSERYSGRLRVAKVDASTQGKTCKEFKVRGLPTLILFRNGKEIDRRSGAMTTSDISSWIDGTFKPENPKESKANQSVDTTAVSAPR